MELKRLNVKEEEEEEEQSPALVELVNLPFFFVRGDSFGAVELAIFSLRKSPKQVI